MAGWHLKTAWLLLDWTGVEWSGVEWSVMGWPGGRAPKTPRLVKNDYLCLSLRVTQTGQVTVLLTLKVLMIRQPLVKN